MAFWRDWWRSRDILDEPIEPVPPAYMPAPAEPVRISDIQER